MDGLQTAAGVVGLVGGGGLAGWIGHGAAKVGSLRQRRRVRRLRTWHGFINLGSISSWYVRLVEEPDAPTARVVLEVCKGPDGKPDVNLAHTMRQHITGDGMLARIPTPTEYEFLRDLHKTHGYGNDPAGESIH
jgi:hypothetical protein